MEDLKSPHVQIAADQMALKTVQDLLQHYGFDLGGQLLDALIAEWEATYAPQWIRSAVIEALYQGRYKGVSVAQILQIWQRRRSPCLHFGTEFEHLVCDQFPRDLADRHSRGKTSQPAWMLLAKRLQMERSEPRALDSSTEILPNTLE